MVRLVVLLSLIAGTAFAQVRAEVRVGGHSGTVVVGGNAGAPADPTSEVVALDEALRAMLGDQGALLAEIGQLAASSSNPAVLRLLHDRLAAAEDLRRRIDGARDRLVSLALRGRTVEVVREVPVVREVQVVREVPVPVAAPVAPTPASPSEMAMIRGAIEGESFSAEKIAVLSSACGNRWFTVGQVMELMGLFSFDDDKVEVAARLFNHVVDQDNWFQVYSALTFSGSKDTLRGRVGR